MLIIYEKNSNNSIFKKLPNGSYHPADLNGEEYPAWALVNGDPLLNTDLDSIII
jgi:hypothetical protein